MAIWPFVKAISPILLDLHSQKKTMQLPMAFKQSTSVTWPPLQRSYFVLLKGLKRTRHGLNTQYEPLMLWNPLTLSCLAIWAWLSNTRMFTARSERSGHSEERPWMADASTVKSCRRWAHLVPSHTCRTQSTRFNQAVWWKSSIPGVKRDPYSSTKRDVDEPLQSKPISGH